MEKEGLILESKVGRTPSNRRCKTPWFLWAHLVLWSVLTTQAFPYVDSSPTAVLAVTGPLCIVLIAGALVKFYWARHKVRSAGAENTYENSDE